MILTTECTENTENDVLLGELNDPQALALLRVEVHHWPVKATQVLQHVTHGKAFFVG